MSQLPRKLSNKLDELKKLASEIFDESIDLNSMLEKEAEGQAIEDKGILTLYLSDRFYDKLNTGRFDGQINIQWYGMDNFIYHPSADSPFAYTTSEGRSIKPKLMNTDGGSIPKLFQSMKNFSPWGYAPAFIIHDWLFVAQEINDPDDKDWSFKESAIVMAEAMKTLMETGFEGNKGEIINVDKSKDVLYLMYLAVSSFIAKRSWEN